MIRPACLWFVSRILVIHHWLSFWLPGSIMLSR